MMLVLKLVLDQCFIAILEYVHMRGEMNSYRFEISSRRENKFFSHDFSFRLHFKTTRYIDGHAQAFHFGQCLHGILSPEMKFYFCQNDRYEIYARNEFQTRMRTQYPTRLSLFISLRVNFVHMKISCLFEISFRSK